MLSWFVYPPLKVSGVIFFLISLEIILIMEVDVSIRDANPNDKLEPCFNIGSSNDSRSCDYGPNKPIKRPLATFHFGGSNKYLHTQREPVSTFKSLLDDIGGEILEFLTVNGIETKMGNTDLTQRLVDIIKPLIGKYSGPTTRPLNGDINKPDHLTSTLNSISDRLGLIEANLFGTQKFQSKDMLINPKNQPTSSHDNYFVGCSGSLDTPAPRKSNTDNSQPMVNGLDNLSLDRQRHGNTSKFSMKGNTPSGSGPIKISSNLEFPPLNLVSPVVISQKGENPGSSGHNNTYANKLNGTSSPFGRDLKNTTRTST